MARGKLPYKARCHPNRQYGLLKRAYEVVWIGLPLAIHPINMVNDVGIQ